MVRMEGAASNKYKNCSLGMKQRIEIAMALLGHPVLLVLDEPINGLDADGMRIMREVLVDLAKNKGCIILISSHILGELEKIATHYGIIRNGKMLKEMTAKELDAQCPTYVALRTENMDRTQALLRQKYSRVEEDEKGELRVYDAESPEEVVMGASPAVPVSELHHRLYRCGDGQILPEFCVGYSAGSCPALGDRSSGFLRSFQI